MSCPQLPIHKHYELNPVFCSDDCRIPGTYSAEREVGLRTNDPRIIANLIKRFDDAKNLEPTEPHANSKPTPQIQTCAIPAMEQDIVDIPFVRPVSYGTRTEMLQDLWEIEANRPSAWLHGK